MIEYLNFFLLCIFLALIFYLHIRAKRYLTLLKMVEENNFNYIFGDDDAPQTEAKKQKFLEFVLTGHNKLYLGKVYTKKRVNELSDEEVDKLF